MTYRVLLRNDWTIEQMGEYGIPRQVSWKDFNLRRRNTTNQKRDDLPHVSMSPDIETEESFSSLLTQFLHPLCLRPTLHKYSIRNNTILPLISVSLGKSSKLKQCLWIPTRAITPGLDFLFLTPLHVYSALWKGSPMIRKLCPPVHVFSDRSLHLLSLTET